MKETSTCGLWYCSVSCCSAMSDWVKHLISWSIWELLKSIWLINPTKAYCALIRLTSLETQVGRYYIRGRKIDSNKVCWSAPHTSLTPAHSRLERKPTVRPVQRSGPQTQTQTKVKLMSQSESRAKVHSRDLSLCLSACLPACLPASLSLSLSLSLSFSPCSLYPSPTHSLSPGCASMVYSWAAGWRSLLCVWMQRQSQGQQSPSGAVRGRHASTESTLQCNKHQQIRKGWEVTLLIPSSSSKVQWISTWLPAYWAFNAFCEGGWTLLVKHCLSCGIELTSLIQQWIVAGRASRD